MTFGESAFIQSIKRSPGVNERWGRFDDDGDLIVVAIDEPVDRGLAGKLELSYPLSEGGVDMNNEPNSYLDQKSPQWMREMFEELSDMFAELLPDADTLNLEEMQQRLDELEQRPMTAAEQPSIGR
jgi:hypothetical protein